MTVQKSKISHILTPNSHFFVRENPHFFAKKRLDTAVFKNAFGPVRGPASPSGL
jgi:hypothetical protein